MTEQELKQLIESDESFLKKLKHAGLNELEYWEGPGRTDNLPRELLVRFLQSLDESREFYPDQEVRESPSGRYGQTGFEWVLIGTMDCKHRSSTLKTIEKDFLDMTFTHKTKVCDDCGAYLRGAEFERVYLSWLEDIYEKRRDKFQVQCHLSTNLDKCMKPLLEDYPGVTPSVLLRVLVTVYLNYIDVNSGLVREFNSLMDREILRSFQKGEKRKFNIQFKPKMMIDIVAVSEIALIKPHQIVETAIIKMMAAFTSHDEKLRKFWEREIRQYVDIALKAA